MSDIEKEFVLYQYAPSTTLAIVFIAIFGVSSAGHIVQLSIKRTWYFIPFVLGGLFETGGYAARMVSSKQTEGEWTTLPYAAQSLLILLAPSLMSASIYMVLGRIIVLVDGEQHSIIRIKWLTKVFVFGDVLSFLAQSTGGGLLSKAKTQKDVNLGQYIIIAGLGIQVVFFQMFCICAGIFHYRIAGIPTTKSLNVPVPWKRFLWVLYFVSALILVRSIFRIAEYAGGHEGKLLSSEIYLYILDAALMAQACIAFNIFHPSRIISRNQHEVSGSEAADTEMGSVEYVGPRK